MYIKIILSLLFFHLSVPFIIGADFGSSAISIALAHTSHNAHASVFASSLAFPPKETDYNTIDNHNALNDVMQIEVNHINLYSTKELNLFQSNLRLPLRLLPIGISIGTFGYTHYRTTNINVSLAKRLGNKSFIGLSSNLLLYHYTGDNGLKKTFEIGIDYDLNFCRDNHFYCKIGYVFLSSNLQDIIYAPFFTSFCGVVIQPSRNSKWLLEIKCVDFTPPTVHLGFEYMVKRFFLRLGAYGLPLKPTYGFGFDNGVFNLCVSSEWNFAIGHSFACDFVFKLPQRTHPNSD